ncbi:F0F1 ATP synthase subunit A [Aliifodinibius sp. S!AR15-10]|uniref:F0F1 ATP synthase subunit A n=1 Tax=Aliifodinibius sp. S!AR15-10 TaxID=2950437 RepID=UPI00286158B3|nr:F0F1 ATP synthase subunit A [Aliifodinibius sp. S!AR15-10]MDR8391121.1 F0F1 ATP synthase subunit A [Aliifodinibius sp. S!AR15-10]
MIQRLRRPLLTVLILLFATSSLKAFQEQEAEKDIPIDVVGKVQDHNYLNVAGYHLELPRILLVDGEWHFYSSTHQAVESGNFVEENHSLIPADGSEITLDLSITSHLMYFWFGVGLTLWLTIAMARRYKKGIGRETEPKGWFQNLFEITFVFVRDDITKTNIPEDKYEKFVPYIFAVFVSITFMNLFGLLPWGVTTTADITVTGVMAAFTFFITQWNGSKDHWEHVFWFPGVPGLMRIILTPIEIIGLFTKPLALAVRLFANMLSGKIMIICILGLIFIFAEFFGSIVGLGSSILVVPLTVALYVLKAFVGVLQAYIFALLSAVFIGMAAEEHHHEEGIEVHA